MTTLRTFANPSDASESDHLSADVQALIALLEQHRVRYLLVGGEAVIDHGHPRLTGAVDFWFDQTSDNVSRLFAALHEYWAGAVPGLADAAELMAPAVIVQFGRPPHRIDLLTSSPASVPRTSTWSSCTTASGRTS